MENDLSSVAVGQVNSKLLAKSIIESRSKEGIKTQCKTIDYKNESGPILEDIVSDCDQISNKNIIAYSKKNANIYPYSTIGVVHSTWDNNQSSWGTGTLIQSNVVLTSAQNVIKLHLKENNLVISKKTIKIQFIIENINSSNSKSTEVEKFFIPEDYMTNANSNEEYAVLFLKDPIGESQGWMGIHSVSQPNYSSFYNEKLFHIYGYPASHIANKSEFYYELWGMEGTVEYHLDFISYKEMEVYVGQNGSPVFYKSENNKYYVIGIHIGKINNINTGLSITEKRFNQIERWILENSRVQLHQYILNFNNSNVCPMAIKYLSSFDLSQLQELCLNSNNFSDHGLEILSGFTSLNSLRVLDMYKNKISSEGIKFLSMATFLFGLESLDLSFNNITDESLKYLANGNFNKIHILRMSGNNITDEGVKNLSLGNLKMVNELYLAGCCIGPDAIKYFDSFYLLNVLNLSANKLGDKGIENLSELSNLNNLHSLFISGNNIQSEGIKHLAKGKLINIKALYLSDNNIGNDGVNYLSFSNMNKLQTLYLENNNIGPDSVKYLSNGNLKELLELYLFDNNIEDEGIKYLSTSSNLTLLQELNISRENLGPESEIYLNQIKSKGVEISFLN